MLTKSYPCVHLKDVKAKEANPESQDEFGLGEVIGSVLQPSELTKTLEVLVFVQWELKKGSAHFIHKASEIINMTDFQKIAEDHGLIASDEIELFQDEEGNLSDEKGNSYFISEDDDEDNTEDGNENIIDAETESLVKEVGEHNVVDISPTTDEDFMNEGSEVKLDDTIPHGSEGTTTENSADEVNQ
jgi:hypothetical protein